MVFFTAERRGEAGSSGAGTGSGQTPEATVENETLLDKATRLRIKRDKDTAWCSVCGHTNPANTTGLRDLSRHIEARHVVAHFRCSVCEVKMKGRRKLREHLTKTHKIFDPAEVNSLMDMHIRKRCDITFNEDTVSVPNLSNIHEKLETILNT